MGAPRVDAGGNGNKHAGDVQPEVLKVRYVIPLAACSGEFAPQVGGKARGLGGLIRFGFDVPAGFAITTTAYEESISSAGIEQRIIDLVDGADTHEAQREASEQIRALFTTDIMGGDVAEEISLAYRELGPGGDLPVAVRSSATAEDTAEASFAGQQDTYLWIRGADQVLAHVVRCWGSLFTPQVIAYRKRFGVASKGLAMGVVVQEIIPATTAGAMMTLDPLTGDKSRIYIEAAYGLGEGVVRGDTGSDRYWLHKSSLKVAAEEVGDKALAHRFDEKAGEVRLVEVPAAERRKPALTANEVQELGMLGRRIEDAFGAAMDVEWAIATADDGRRRIKLLQARGETVWSRRAAAGDESEEPSRQAFAVDASRHTVLNGRSRPKSLWTTTNIGEAMPGVLTPLGFSLWGPAAEMGTRLGMHAVGVLTRQEAQWPAASEDRFINIFFGQAAVRIDFLAMLADRVPGTSGEALTRQMFTELPPGFESEHTNRQYFNIARKFPIAFLRTPRQVRAALPEVTAWWRDAIAASHHADEAGARRLLAEGQAEFNRHVQRQALLVFSAVQPVFDALSRFVAAAGGSSHELMGGHGSHAEAEVVHDLWACSRGKLSLDDFLSRHGYHGPHEGELSSQVWRENSAPVRKLLDGYRAKGDGADPILGEKRRAEERQHKEVELLSRLPLTGRLTGRVLFKLAKHILPLRGVAKISFLQSFDVCRAAARRLGQLLAARGVLAQAEDVFYLTVDELLGELPLDVKSVVIERRREHRAYHAVKLPRAWQGQPEPLFVSDVPADGGGASGELILKGIGASAGVIEGFVRVAQSPDAEVEEGEILVAHVTDPGWASIMYLSSGLIVDIGGLMSHTAVVAREFNIPCIVDTKVATQRLRTGDFCRLDGSKGTIEILRRADEAAAEPVAANPWFRPQKLRHPHEGAPDRSVA